LKSRRQIADITGVHWNFNKNTTAKRKRTFRADTEAIVEDHIAARSFFCSQQNPFSIGKRSSPRAAQFAAERSQK